MVTVHEHERYIVLRGEGNLCCLVGGVSCVCAYDILQITVGVGNGQSIDELWGYSTRGGERYVWVIDAREHEMRE